MKKIPHLLCIVLMLSFLLGIQGNKLALWDADDPNPLYIFPIDADQLPLRRQKALRDGIPIRDGTELVEVLKEYLS